MFITTLYAGFKLFIVDINFYETLSRFRRKFLL